MTALTTFSYFYLVGVAGLEKQLKVWGPAVEVVNTWNLVWTFKKTWKTEQNLNKKQSLIKIKPRKTQLK